MNHDLTVIYYTSNWLERTNPYFLKNTTEQLLKATDGLPIIAVSHTPINFGKNREPAILNLCLGHIGRSHLNIYRQILEGCKLAKTKYVAMAEDDILYSWEHFHTAQIDKERRKHGDVLLYDMSKMSIFTWSKPPLFSFRTKRRVVNQLIAPRQMLIDALEERFARLPVLIDEIKRDHPEIEDPVARVIKYWGDPGRYEDILGVTVRPAAEYYCEKPSIVFSHPEAFGYLNQGKKKKLGDIRIVELADWGRAEDMLKLYYEPTK